ncbi:MAG: hypothetical protein V4590_13185 [Bacteroidota bacterium]
MKKLLALTACIVLGFAAAYAQTPTKQAPAATPAPASMNANVAVVAEPSAGEAVVETKKADKKECTTAEKKACETKSGKKSCCSHDAKKEGGK